MRWKLSLESCRKNDAGIWFQLPFSPPCDDIGHEFLPFSLFPLIFYT